MTNASSTTSSPGTEDPRLDPEMRVMLERMQAKRAGRPPIGASPPAEMRARFAQDVAAWNAQPPPIARIVDDAIAGPNRRIPVRFYDPLADGRPNATLVYFHGGGWVVGDLDSNDRALRLLALQSGVAILSVDYCLAPEHPFPAPLEECIFAARWARQHGARLGIDGERLGLGGDSAGANLALAAALDLGDAGESWLRFLLLVCGAYARSLDTPSCEEFGDGRFGFDRVAMAAFWSYYLGAASQPPDPRAEPLYAELRGLPPLYLVAAGMDPLRDDTRRLAARVIEAGGAVEYREYPGVVHGFASMTRDLAIARRATAEAASALRRGLEQTGEHACT